LPSVHQTSSKVHLRCIEDRCWQMIMAYHTKSILEDSLKLLLLIGPKGIEHIAIQQMLELYRKENRQILANFNTGPDKTCLYANAHVRLTPHL